MNSRPILDAYVLIIAEQLDDLRLPEAYGGTLADLADQLLEAAAKLKAAVAQAQYHYEMICVGDVEDTVHQVLDQKLAEHCPWFTDGHRWDP